MGGLRRRIGEGLRAAAHAAGGAPRLYRAARSAGAGRVEAAHLLASSAVVLLLVAPRAAGVPGRQNAVRHFVWQALLSARHGSAVAGAVGDAQEHGSSRRRDSAVDLSNNAAGRQYGAAHAAEISALSERAAMQRLLRVGLARWEAGELSDGRAAARAGRRRRGSRGRATPRRRP